MNLSIQRRELLLLLAFGCASLAPLGWNLGHFQDLFLYGDEWDQLDQIQQHGYLHWVFSFFGENFAPLFKLTWGAGILLCGGSYFGLIALGWLVHAANVFLLGRWLRQTGFGWAGTLCAMALLGLTVGNIETLAWSIQLLTLQGMMFFLAAALFEERLRQRNYPPSTRSAAILLALVAASTFSFVRGVLTGATLAFASLWPPSVSDPQILKRRLRLAVLCILPAIASGALIAGFTGGNQQPPPPGAGGTVQAASTYALLYFFLNPFYRLIEMDSWGWRTLIVMAALKLSLLAWALLRATGPRRRLLLTVLAFDIGTAMLLGLGRYHTGFETAISSRYQYTSLICTLPFAGLFMEVLIERLVRTCAWRLPAGAVLAILTAVWVGRHWEMEMEKWSDWRGREPRQTLLLAETPAYFAVGGIPSMPTRRAKELVERYDLR